MVLVTGSGPRCWHTVVPAKATVVPTFPLTCSGACGWATAPEGSLGSGGASVPRCSHGWTRVGAAGPHRVHGGRGQDHTGRPHGGRQRGPGADRGHGQGPGKRSPAAPRAPAERAQPSRPRGAGEGPEFRTAQGEGPRPEGGSFGGPAAEGAGQWQLLASRLRSWRPACLWGDLGACRGLQSPQPALCTACRLTGWITWRSTSTTSSTDTSSGRAEPTVSEGLSRSEGSLQNLGQGPQRLALRVHGPCPRVEQTCWAGLCLPEPSQTPLDHMPAGRAALAEDQALSGPAGSRRESALPASTGVGRGSKPRPPLSVTAQPHGALQP